MKAGHREGLHWILGGSLMGRNKKEIMIAIPTIKKPSNTCPVCCYSDGSENYDDDGSWTCRRCGDAGEP